MASSAATIDLYWLPLGAGGHSVRLNGKAFEVVAAWLDGRDRHDLYHSALQVDVPEGRYVIEQAPAWSDGAERGVVAEGAVGARAAGRLRLFRYEVRRWRDGIIPDLAEAVESPLRLSEDLDCARRLLQLVPEVPTPVWGRDELGAGEMWNSNSLISWLIARSGLAVQSIHPPRGGRAPGWRAGIVVAFRQLKQEGRPRTASPVLSPNTEPGPVRERRRLMMSTGALLKRGSLAFGAIGVAAVLYRRILRGPILNWGATAAEAHGRLPGDELLEEADGVATRAITIAAPASAVWPWIAQIGPSPRGGAYTYDWIENLLGLNMHSANRVLPEYQHPQLGETLGYGKNRMRFERVEPGRVLSTRSEDGNWVWSFVLDEHDGKTRLISRNRFRLPSLTARIGMVPMEPASLVMERKMLRGIKERAERLAAAERRKAGGVAS